ncbi:Na+/H+ antiporter, partial [Elasticomyces elasticus]
MPQRSSDAQGQDEQEQKEELEERDRIDREGDPPSRERERFGREPVMEVFLEGKHMIIEDEEGNVLKTEDVSHKSTEEQQQQIDEMKEKLRTDESGEFAKSLTQPHEKTEGEEVKQAVDEKAGGPIQRIRERLGRWGGFGKSSQAKPPVEEGEETEEENKAEAAAHAKKATEKKKKAEKTGRSAHAYQFGNTIIVEDEDGEVLKKYSIPSASTEEPETTKPVRRGLTRMGTWFGVEDQPEPSKKATKEQKSAKKDEWMADDGLRFTVAGNDDVESKGVNHKGQRMDKHEFIRQIQSRGPRARRDMVQESDAPQHVKNAAEDQYQAANRQERRKSEAQALENQNSRDLSPKSTARADNKNNNDNNEDNEDAASDSGSSSNEDGGEGIP